MPPTKKLARKRPATEPSKRPSKRVAAATTNGHDEPDEEPEDDEAETSTPAMKSAASDMLGGGWTEGQRQNEASSSYAKSFRPEQKMQAIKFLQDAPYVSFRRHWIDSMNDQGQRTTRAYVCLASLKKPQSCPLCEVGDKAQAVNCFNIALIGDDGQVLLRSWDVGVRLYNVLKGYSNDPKTAPLSKLYYLVSKTGEKTATQYNVAPVRAASLEEDYDVMVPDQSEFDRLELYTPEVVEILPVRKLRELAQELATDG
jgi:hypothetical protein